MTGECGVKGSIGAGVIPDGGVGDPNVVMVPDWLPPCGEVNW